MGKDKTPNEVYATSGEASILQLAALLCKVKKEGPPIEWREGQLFPVPHKPQLPLTPLNSRGILSADHKVNHFSAALRRATSPYLESTMKGNQSGAVKK